MIYILEDDDGIRELIAYSLNKTGNEAAAFSRPSEFWHAVAERLPQLVLLDIMLPEEDGLAVLWKLKENSKTKNIPVIMLTAKVAEFDKVRALDAGADDYITKPFGVMELIARVKAVLRRAAREVQSEGGVYVADNIRLSVPEHELTVAGKPITLTLKEFELLTLLFENRGTVLSRDKILSEIWGYEFDGENRTVDVHVRTMRQKLGAAADIVETVRGVGYKIR